MTRKVLTLSDNGSVLDAVKKMEVMNVGAIVIVGEKKKVIGIFSERDLLRRVCAENKDMAATGISEVMTKDPQVLTSETPLVEALALTQTNDFRHIPIVDDASLVGMVSIKDITNVIKAQLGKVLFDDKA